MIAPGALPWAVRQAATLGRFDDLLADSEFLVYADPRKVLAELDTAGVDDGLTRALYRHDAGRLRSASSTERRHLLTLNAARYAAWSLVEALVAGDPAAVPWTPSWFTGAEQTFSLYRVVTMPDWDIERVIARTIGGRLIVAALGESGVVSAWDAILDEPLGLPWTVPDHQNGSLSLCQLHDRAIAVAGTQGGRVLTHDLLTGEPLREFYMDGMAGARVVTADTELGPVVAAVGFAEGSGEFRAWNLDTGDLMTRYSHPGASLVSVTTADTTNGVVVVVGDWTGRVGFLPLGADVPQWAHQHQTAIARMDSARIGGRALVVSVDVFGSVVVWDPLLAAPLELPTPVSRLVSPAVALTEIGGRPNLVLANGGGISVVDLIEATVDNRLTGSPNRVTAIDTVRTDDHEYAVIGSGGHVRMFDLGIREPIPPPTPRQSIREVATAEVDGEGVVLTVDHDSQVVVLDASTGRPAGRQVPHPADWLAVVENTTWLALASHRGNNPPPPVLLDLRSGQLRNIPQGGPGTAVSSLAAAQLDGTIIVAMGYSDSTIEVWRDDGRPLLELHPHNDELTVSKLLLTQWAGQALLVSGSSGGTLAVTDLGTGHTLQRRTAHPGSVTALALSAASSLVVATGSYDGTLRTWQGLDLQPGNDRPDAHADTVTAVAITRSQQNPTLISSGDDATLRSWVLKDLTPQTSLTLPSRAQALTPLGSDLVAAMGAELFRLRPTIVSGSNSEEDW